MDSKKMELATIVTGSLAILAAVYFGFIAASSVHSAKITNYIFAGAFFMFIVYNFLKTTEYEKVNKQLSDEVARLNEKVHQLTEEIREKSQTIDNLNNEITQKNKKITEIENNNKKLSEKVANLEELVNELNQKISNSTV